MAPLLSIFSSRLRQQVADANAEAVPAMRAALPDAEAWMVFGMRLLLSLSVLLTLDIGTRRVVLHDSWSWMIFLAYALHSLILLAVARYKAGFWHGPVIYWVDIGWYGMMACASGGGASPFFSLFFFAILAVSFRHGFDAGARLTLGSAVVVALAVLVADRLDTVYLMLRVTFVLALGYMIAFWGGLAVDQRRRLAMLRDVSRLSNPRFGVQRTLDSLMEKILRFFGADTCVLLMQDADGSWMLNTVHNPRSGRAISRSRPDAADVQPLLVLGGSGPILYRGRSDGCLSNLAGGALRASALASGERGWSQIDAAACEWVADLLDARGFISAPLPLLKGGGRIFVTSAARLRRGDATFLNHVAQQAFPVIETIDLLDRLATGAAFRERQTIARDLHDSTIQPYIGLRHAVAAIRKQAGDDNSLAPDLDRLLEMSSDVIGDMREFAQRFRHGRQQEPELLIALRRQLGQIRDFYHVNVTLEVPPATSVNDRMAAEVFQIVAEGVSNICRHTRARSASVRLAEQDGELAIDIANPADGTATGSAAAAFLPKSIADRVRALGGTLTVDATAQQTCLHIRVPA